jgi:hypothetical protein
VAPLRTTQLYGGKVISTTRQNLYTVPAGKVIILKTVSLRNEYTGVQTFKLYFERGGSEYGVIVQGIAAAPSSLLWTGWIAFNPGDVLWATVSNVAGVDVVLSGSLLYI